MLAASREERGQVPPEQALLAVMRALRLLIAAPRKRVKFNAPHSDGSNLPRVISNNTLFFVTVKSYVYTESVISMWVTMCKRCVFLVIAC